MTNSLPSIQEAARRLGGDVSGEEILCPGPGHSAKDRSLSVRFSSDDPEGFITHSFAEGDDGRNWQRHREHVRKLLGSPPWQPNGKGRYTEDDIDAVYPYRDEWGDTQFQVVRFKSKDFLQRRPNGNGGWIWGLKGVRIVPYYLPELLEAIAGGKVVFVVEGEKDADNLAKLNIVATCNSMGAGKWRKKKHASHLKGADVVVIPDNDEAGRDHAESVAASLQGIATRVRVLTLPDLPPKEDVSYWLKRGGTAEQLWALVERAPDWKPGEKPNTQPTAGDDEGGVQLEDFRAYLPAHSYIYIPSRDLWPAASIDRKLPPIKVDDKLMRASQWLDINRSVVQMTWAPGEPLEIRDKIIVNNSGWVARKGVTVFNLYQGPTIKPGNAANAGRWVDHVHKVFPGDGDAEHAIDWLAHRVQRPQEKINHALLLGGEQGVGKDTLLEPVMRAVGPWNVQEISPQDLLGRFTGFAKSVILRISEAHDLGEVSRYTFYERLKKYAAAPPYALRIDEKNLREHNIPNCCGVVLTTNHKTIYLPANDRRHYVAWSPLTREDFEDGYWPSLWAWYGNGGDADVAAFLLERDLSKFDPKAPPPKTDAFFEIVAAGVAPEDAELADALDALGNPKAITLERVTAVGSAEFVTWANDRKTRRSVPFRFEQCGYARFRNKGADDGLWKINGRRQVVYVRNNLPEPEKLKAARALSV
jgi:Family of unknown function (DUF5906)/Toprim-like